MYSFWVTELLKQLILSIVANHSLWLQDSKMHKISIDLQGIFQSGANIGELLR